MLFWLTSAPLINRRFQTHFNVSRHLSTSISVRTEAIRYVYKRARLFAGDNVHQCLKLWIPAGPAPLEDRSMWRLQDSEFALHTCGTQWMRKEPWTKQNVQTVFVSSAADIEHCKLHIKNSVSSEIYIWSIDGLFVESANTWFSILISA